MHQYFADIIVDYIEKVTGMTTDQLRWLCRTTVTVVME